MSRGAVRVAGGVVGTLLLVAAVLVALRKADLGAALASMVRPGGEAMRDTAVLALATIGGLILSGEVLLRLTRRFGAVDRREMLLLVLAANLLNYLPMRPGFFGRLAWHRTVNGISTAALARTIGEAIAVTAVAVTALGAALLAVGAAGWPWQTAAILPLAAPVALGMSTRGRVYALPLALRHGELLLLALRLHVALAIVGSVVSPGAALALAVVAMAASMVPLVGNGLGVREWAVGLLAPLLAATEMAVGVSADLVSRAVEVAVVVPAGLVAMALLWRWRGRRARPVTTRA